MANKPTILIMAIVSVTVALGLSLALQYYQFRGVEVPVLTPRHRRHHLVRGQRTRRAGDHTVLALLRLLLYGAPLLPRNYQ